MAMICRKQYCGDQNDYIIYSQSIKLCNVFGIIKSAGIYVCNVCLICVLRVRVSRVSRCVVCHDVSCCVMRGSHVCHAVWCVWRVRVIVCWVGWCGVSCCVTRCILGARGCVLKHLNYSCVTQPCLFIRTHTPHPLHTQTWHKHTLLAHTHPNITSRSLVQSALCTQRSGLLRGPECVGLGPLPV